MKNDSSSDASKYCSDKNGDKPHLFEFVAQKKWKKLRKLLKKKKGDCSAMCKTRDSTGLSLFGFAILSGAPKDLLDTILAVDSTQSQSPDSYGATPLHIACLNGSSPQSVKYLIDISGGELVRARDVDERVPLHHAVECLARNEISFNDAKECIQRLLKVDSSLIHCNDKNSDTPIDIVQIARMNDHGKPSKNDPLQKLYKLLTDFSIMEYKRNKERWESQGFDKRKHYELCCGKNFLTTLLTEPISEISISSAYDASENQ